MKNLAKSLLQTAGVIGLAVGLQACALNPFNKGYRYGEPPFEHSIIMPNGHIAYTKPVIRNEKTTPEQVRDERGMKLVKFNDLVWYEDTNDSLLNNQATFRTEYDPEDRPLIEKEIRQVEKYLDNFKKKHGPNYQW